MLLISAGALALCFIDSSEWLTVTLITGIAAYYLLNSGMPDDGLTAEQSALQDAIEGMENRKKRSQSRRPLFPSSDQEQHAASREAQAEFEEMLDKGRQEEQAIWDRDRF